MSFAAILAVLPHAIQAAEFAAKTLKLLNQPTITKEDMKALEEQFRASQASLQGSIDELREVIDRMPDD